MRDHYNVTLTFNTEPDVTSFYDVERTLSELVTEAYLAFNVDLSVNSSLEYDEIDDPEDDPS